MSNIGSKIISIIFHPLFMLMYILLLLLLVNPLLMGHFTIQGKLIFMVYFVVNTIVIPVLAILLMKVLGLIGSFQMENKRERIGPMIVVFILYMWMFINFRKEPDIPLILVSVMLGTVLATALAFIINVLRKISLHMTGMGGLLAAIAIIFLHYKSENLTLHVFQGTIIQVHIVLILIFVVLMTGFVAAARLYLKAHKPAELLQGIILGTVSQFLAYWIIF